MDLRIIPLCEGHVLKLSPSRRIEGLTGGTSDLRSQTLDHTISDSIMCRECHILSHHFILKLEFTSEEGNYELEVKHSNGILFLTFTDNDVNACPLRQTTHSRSTLLRSAQTVAPKISFGDFRSLYFTDAERRDTPQRSSEAKPSQLQYLLKDHTEDYLSRAWLLECHIKNHSQRVFSEVSALGGLITSTVKDILTQELALGRLAECSADASTHGYFVESHIERISSHGLTLLRLLETYIKRIKSHICALEYLVEAHKSSIISRASTVGRYTGIPIKDSCVQVSGESTTMVNSAIQTDSIEWNPLKGSVVASGSKHVMEMDVEVVPSNVSQRKQSADESNADVSRVSSLLCLAKANVWQSIVKAVLQDRSLDRQKNLNQSVPSKTSSPATSRQDSAAVAPRQSEFCPNTEQVTSDSVSFKAIRGKKKKKPRKMKQTLVNVSAQEFSTDSYEKENKSKHLLPDGISTITELNSENCILGSNELPEASASRQAARDEEEKAVLQSRPSKYLVRAYLKPTEQQGLSPKFKVTPLSKAESEMSLIKYSRKIHTVSPQQLLISSKKETLIRKIIKQFPEKCSQTKDWAQPSKCEEKIIEKGSATLLDTTQSTEESSQKETLPQQDTTKSGFETRAKNGLAQQDTKLVEDNSEKNGLAQQDTTKLVEDNSEKNGLAQQDTTKNVDDNSEKNGLAQQDTTKLVEDNSEKNGLAQQDTTKSGFETRVKNGLTQQDTTKLVEYNSEKKALTSQDTTKYVENTVKKSLTQRDSSKYGDETRVKEALTRQDTTKCVDITVRKGAFFQHSSKRLAKDYKKTSPQQALIKSSEKGNQKKTSRQSSSKIPEMASKKKACLACSGMTNEEKALTKQPSTNNSEISKEKASIRQSSTKAAEMTYKGKLSSHHRTSKYVHNRVENKRSLGPPQIKMATGTEPKTQLHKASSQISLPERHAAKVSSKCLDSFSVRKVASALDLLPQALETPRGRRSSLTGKRKETSSGISLASFCVKTKGSDVQAPVNSLRGLTLNFKGLAIGGFLGDVKIKVKKCV